ncbi:Txe/YoeB family addiction module toxin [Limosilactobacillus fermentum]|uniref:Txe/YoeB family addiction module toxin n=1 Tax=Limosilactobacillus fermentum TaxID=1613 RepID=UPI000EE5A586|nr:Txe/YoeB family addiction module toxin [Limosilactobacillus fermentum]MCQ2007646.1 Txe/YoeB family addiction module toxin [Limosilactobacillus fermentum]RGW54096.1 Txe/YoeB family addiction module toxin [Limosilactobacillus fermentum]
MGRITKIVWTPDAWSDFEWWIDNDVAKVDRIRTLIKAIRRDSFRGIGKPEALRGNLQGFWSRRIDREHRLVYSIEQHTLNIVAARYHY